MGILARKSDPSYGGCHKGNNAQYCTNRGRKLLGASAGCGAAHETAGYATGSLDSTTEEVCATCVSDVVVKGTLTGKQ